MKSEIAKHNTKNTITLIFLISIIAVLLIYPSKCSAGVKLGINISLYSLIPAILPFMIFSNFVIKSGYSTLIGRLVHPLFGKLFKTSPNGSYAVALGFLCGYPLGAKIVSDLIKSGKITPEEGGCIFKFINNPSPAFILCYAASLSFPDTSLKIAALVSIYLPSLLIGILSPKADFSGCGDNTSKTAPNHYQTNAPFSKVIDDSIFDAFVTIAKLTGYIIIFSVISILITSLSFVPYTIRSIIPCTLELTSGIYQISASELTVMAKFFLTVVFSVFGGLSVVFQINSVIHSSALHISTYIKYKLISMLLCSIICLMIISLKLI